MQNTMQAVRNEAENQKAVLGVHRHGSAHMVGDGFPVRNMIPGGTIDEQLSPFLMLDYLGPEQFPPTDRRLGVGEHPHRGFETVTIMYHGKVAHRDSTGSGGVIGPGSALAGIIRLPAFDFYNRPLDSVIRAVEKLFLGARGRNCADARCSH